MDLTKVCTTFPQLGEPNIQRENMIMTIEGMLQNNDIVTVEGLDGIGKTTLLAQFASALPEQTFCLFIRASSRWAYDSQILTRNLCDQIGWVLYKEEYMNNGKEIELTQLLRKRLQELQRKSNSEQKKYYFVVDGLQDIPEAGKLEKESILNILPFRYSSLLFYLIWIF